jgi:Flp pilus assembly protein TadG
VTRHPARRSSRNAALGAHPADATKQPRRDRGTAAVEFALVMPILLILVLGIAEFGRAYNIQTTLSGAARVGVRVMALENSASAARTSTRNAADPVVNLSDAQIFVSPSCPAPGTSSSTTATVTVNYTMTFITDFFGTVPLNLTGKGVMRCNG